MTSVESARQQGRLLGPNEVLVTDSVVTTEEQSILWDWAQEQYRNGKLLNTPSDPGAYSTPFHSERRALTCLTNLAAQHNPSPEQRLIWLPEVDDEQVDPLPEEFWNIRARVIDLLGLHELEEDHYKGSFLSYIAPGTGVHAHKDARLMIHGEERPILRCNVLFKRPEQGGLPVIETTEVDVPDRGMWAFFPTELLHAATPVGGSYFRGLLSFGLLVRLADFWQRRFQVARSFEMEYGLDSGDAPRRALLMQLRSAPEAQDIDKARIDLLEFILTSSGDFSVQQAAESLHLEPSDTWEALRDLQRSDVVESASSRCREQGNVMVL